MRRTWIVVGMLVIAAGAAAYQRGSNWKEFHFTGSRLMADLAHPDAMIRTTSLAKLPGDLLKAPIARDVLTEDLAFYYEQHEDRLGLNGAIKRIAYEHKLAWTDHILISVLNEPAEIAFWRDGKGALRHYAFVLRRNALTKVLQQAATLALKDAQLKRAGEISTAGGPAIILALEINPRRTLLLISHSDRIVVLSDPGLLFSTGNEIVPAAGKAVTDWLENEGALAQQFALGSVKQQSVSGQTRHTLAMGAPTLALGYGAFLPGFKGLRLDFSGTWSTSVWIDQKSLPGATLGDAALWRAAPANPGACALLPVDWRTVRKVLVEADNKPPLSDIAGTAADLATLDGSALACWYSESKLYSPVFITRLTKSFAQRNTALTALAKWAIGPGDTTATAGIRLKSADNYVLWRDPDNKAAVAARGEYVVFSPDGALVDKVLDTLARGHPSVADQVAASDGTLALLTPRSLSEMAGREIMAALSGPGDANLLAAAQTHLPARMHALATYPQYRLELTSEGKFQESWKNVEWLETGKIKDKVK